MLNLGRTLVGLGKVDEGLAKLKQAKDLNPNDAQIRYWYARTFVELKRTQEAAVESDYAAQLDPHNPRAVYQAALAWQAVNNHEKALPWLDIATTLPPYASDLQFTRAFSLQQVGRLPEAMVLYQSFLKDHPNHASAHFNLGYAHVVRNECAQAISEMERTLALDPSRAAAHLHIANCSKAVGNMPVAQLHQAAWEKSQNFRAR
jgi:tetratricopeptide (TPR) repeat protein